MGGRYILSRFRSLKESPAFLKVPTTPVSYFSHDCSSLPFQLPESFQRLSWLQVRHCSNRFCIDLLMCMHLSKLMAERHALRKGSTESCSVAGCGEPAMKSVSAREADKKAAVLYAHYRDTQRGDNTFPFRCHDVAGIVSYNKRVRFQIIQQSPYASLTDPDLRGKFRSSCPSCFVNQRQCFKIMKGAKFPSWPLFRFAAHTEQFRKPIVHPLLFSVLHTYLCCLGIPIVCFLPRLTICRVSRRCPVSYLHCWRAVPKRACQSVRVS